MEVAKFRRQKSSYKIGVAKMTKIAKAQVTKMEKENEGKIPVSKFIGWWLDPKNGKVGEEFTKQDGSKGKTTSFHAVTSPYCKKLRVGKSALYVQSAREKLAREYREYESVHSE